MSKHEKALKRERRKADRARRASIRNPQSAIRNGGAALAAAAAIAAGTSAYASPVRFDNPAGPGHFDWANPPSSLILLDLTLSAADQAGNDGPSVLGQQVDESVPVGKVGGDPYRQVGIGFPNQYFLVGVSADTLIPTPGTGWGGGGPSYIGDFYGYPSLLPEGAETYLGIRFDLGGGNQYGWIGVVRSGNALDAFAWGYEMEVGVPVPAGAPEPGTLALLAMGAVGVLRRRRSA